MNSPSTGLGGSGEHTTNLWGLQPPPLGEWPRAMGFVLKIQFRISEHAAQVLLCVWFLVKHFTRGTYYTSVSLGNLTNYIIRVSKMQTLSNHRTEVLEE